MSTPYNITVRLDPSGAQQGGRQVESALGRIEQRMLQLQRLPVLTSVVFSSRAGAKPSARPCSAKGRAR